MTPDPTPPETAVLPVLRAIDMLATHETPLVALLHRNAEIARRLNEEAANDPEPEDG